MPKLATKWKTENGFDSVVSTSGNILLEGGGNILLETGGILLLEKSKVTAKPSVEWIGVAKNRSSWSMEDGFSTAITNVKRTRATAQGDRRVIAQGDTRVTSRSTFTRKKATLWEYA